jgi:tetratricopeptide (TPR) repeat protein
MIALWLALALAGTQYPAHWWAPVSEVNKPAWEILPQAAQPGEVILSKRNELGILSNFAATAFTLHGKRYASVEGFWQMLLYPEGPGDPRLKNVELIWPHTREQVGQMTAFEAKDAGTIAEDNMRKLGIDWVTFEGRRMPYRSKKKGEHYALIVEAMRAKLEQNPEVRKILLSTGDLILRPDHIQEADAPPEWQYFQIWMDLRAELSKVAFFDEPTFTVAGVSDASSHGGHGSDTILRSGETLAEATAALGKTPASEAAPLQVVREYQQAAESDASEVNLFTWGAELLRHRAALQAQQVFARGSTLYPRSERMLLGLGAADFSLGSFQEAAQHFFAASDLNPTDAEPYLFMGTVRSMEVMQSDELRQRLERFAELQPDNALANYYYGASLWRYGAPEEAEALLKKAIALDPKLAEAYLSLGVAYAERKDFTSAVAVYKQAIDVNPQMEQTHYRLGQAYMHLGDEARATKEFELYRQLSRTAAEEAERKRSEIQDFVFALKKN